MAQSISKTTTQKSITDKELKRRVLIHWAHNLRKAKAGKLTAGDISSDKCAFCTAHVDEDECYNCPIAQSGNYAGCEGTPYDNIHIYIRAEDVVQVIKSVEAEYNFLKALKV